jgi:hypothetical protein
MGTGEDVLFTHQKTNAHHLTMGTPYPDDAGIELNSELSSLSSVTIRYSRCHFNGWPWLLSNPSEAFSSYQKISQNESLSEITRLSTLQQEDALRIN